MLGSPVGVDGLAGAAPNAVRTLDGIETAALCGPAQRGQGEFFAGEGSEGDNAGRACDVGDYEAVEVVIHCLTVKPKITAVDPGAELRWTSSLPPFISGEHSFTLTEAGGGTQLMQAETFSGLLVPLAGKTFARAETSFQGLNEAIRKRAEVS